MTLEKLVWFIHNVSKEAALEKFGTWPERFGFQDKSSTLRGCLDPFILEKLKST